MWQSAVAQRARSALLPRQRPASALPSLTARPRGEARPSIPAQSPAKTLREAILQLTGFAVKALYGNGSRRRGDPSLQDLSSPVNAIIERETEVVRAQFKRNVALYPGSTHFLDPHVVEVQGDGDESNVKGAKILVACGTRPAHSPEFPLLRWPKHTRSLPRMD